MKKILFATALICASAAALADPAKIIFDTDMISDYDDVGAMACLHALADAGECEILATVTCTRDNASVAAVEIINAWYGRPDIPVGCTKGLGVSGPRVEDHDVHGHDKYLALRKRYPQGVKHPNSNDAPDALDVYRRVLAAQPDGSVTICSVGFLSNLRRLVEAEPELVAKKVKVWVAMACNHPNGKEYNSRWDAESSAIALAKWPTPIVFTDFQYGRDVYTGRRIAEDATARGPVKEIFAENLTPRAKCTATSWDRLAGHPSWDETAVLYAVRGTDEVFRVERGSYRMVGTAGDDVWTADPAGRDCRLVEKMPKAKVGELIDELMCREPAFREGAEVDVTDFGVPNDGSADVSAHVTELSRRYSLYFPCGRYRVSKPIALRHSIRGAGYRREPKMEAGGTWFLSDIAAASDACAVFEYADGARPINIENLNIRCSGREGGIRLAEKRTGYTLISKVGVYDLRGTAVFVDSKGSRKFFCDNLTVFGARDYPEGSRGMYIAGTPDSRLSGIEIMGTQIGLELKDGSHYGNNLHLWTGCMAGKDNGKWWAGTRALILHGYVIFYASEIYPDTSFYAIEMKDQGNVLSLDNVMYWEDGTCKGTPSREGSFIKNDIPGNRIRIRGGQIDVDGRDDKEGWMRNVYYEGDADISEVTRKCNYKIRPENFRRLCFNTALPDYRFTTGTNAANRVADVFTLADTGSCEATLSLEDGAAWRIVVEKTAKGAAATAAATPLNALCKGREVVFKVNPGLVEAFLAGAPATMGRFTTARMGTRFRPVDHGTLRTHWGACHLDRDSWE